MESLRKVLMLGCALAVAGCAQGGTSGALPPGISAAPPQTVGIGSPLGRKHRGSGYDSAIYLFQGSPDAVEPQVGLARVGDTMYGTTVDGGKYTYGAVYSVTTGGSEKVMHSFPTGSTDGYYPEGPLTAVHGTLYGTTNNNEDRSTGDGTLFSITPSGSYKIIWHFGLTNGDCNAPYGALTYVPNEKALYGLAAGGTDSYGCIFKWNIAKKSESVVYSFTTPSGNPNGGLVFYKDALYGTTEEGGVYGAGSVFKVTLSGRFNTIHSFSASAKSKKFAGGHYPLSALTVVGDTFYGTTELGGKSQVGACGSAGCGTIFKMTPGGKETVLHDFLDTSQGDGIEPQSPITEINGTLYGTAPSGGAGYGIIYALSPSGSPAYHVFFTFTDGSGYPLIPLAPVISIGGNLYGTTQRGGVACPGYGDFGCGTVYAVPLSSK